MSNEFPGGPNPPPKPVSPPYVTSPAENTKVGQNFRVQGGGHARHRVRVVTPGKEDALSAEQLMEGNGHFNLQINKPLSNGQFCFQILLWKDGNALARSPTHCVEVI
ncbi:MULTISPECIES: hypothetical protein [Pseudomonas]|jgi:hypothetical protein|uniref:hypothetical protein n=1 Tax=Pseudomonas TaxID=286 RepID=UPI0011A051AB|nr:MULTISPECIES: hypothetical protein [Pseudomonas]TWC19347.1 hypothetical protein FBY05_11152 [Pseudomonas sp. SJZ083]TWC46355.1 hypothetical protein FBY01_11152 [Pseudomonas sp. SJZ077]